ncbi:centromere protein X isoform X2 [Meles meles]|uniref:centromere protein X isoform X2 n=1 Tax=Meles meles TaxID=9662 RepID=UPI001E69B0C8|nr:centromere protein X isoform X2 [Meles meles]
MEGAGRGFRKEPPHPLVLGRRGPEAYPPRGAGAGGRRASGAFPSTSSGSSRTSRWHQALTVSAGRARLPLPDPMDLVNKLLHAHFTDGKTKVGGDALRLMAELLTVFVVEAAVRSVRQAQAEDLALVDVAQLEKVLPQLLLDF